MSEQNSIKDLREFDDHKLISYIQDEKTNLEGFIIIHRNNPVVPSFGATRLWNYGSELEALNDALRLSKMMSYKAALAGLNCGGAKAVIMHKPHRAKDPKERKALLQCYADKVNFLKGQFITGTDVGIGQDDLEFMKEKSPYFVGFNDNSTDCTVLGIFESIKICLNQAFETDDMTNKKFAIQGLGKVGSGLLKMIYEATEGAAKIYISDINPDTVKEIHQKFPNVIPTYVDEIHKQSVDVFCPCALSHSLNARTISQLKARVVVGGANNQLANEEIGTLLYKLGIIYAPDYVVNAGGLIAVFDEFEHKKLDEKRVLKAVMKIPATLEKILNTSYKKRKATNMVANEMAERIFNGYA